MFERDAGEGKSRVDAPQLRRNRACDAEHCLASPPPGTLCSDDSFDFDFDFFLGFGGLISLGGFFLITLSTPHFLHRLFDSISYITFAK
jgi:hypothetical protein